MEYEGLLTILRRTFEEGGFWAIIGIAFGCLVLILLVILRARVLTLIALYYVLSFSFFPGTFGTIFTGIRWLALMAMLPLAWKGLRDLGTGVYALWVYGALGVLFCFRAPNVVYALEKGIGHLLMLVALPGSLQAALDRGMRPEKLLKSMCLLGGIWTFVNSLPLAQHLQEMAAQRFAGGADTPGSLALIQGLLLPFVIWGMFTDWSTIWRWLSLITAGLLSVLLVFGATRGGSFMAALISIPLVLRASTRRLAVIAAATCLILACIYFALVHSGVTQREFISDRYTTLTGRAALTGRAELWEDSFREILKSPLWGRGTSSATIFGRQFLSGSSPHNAYLIVWYETGLFGLCAFMLAMLLNIVLGLRLMLLSRGAPKVNLLARLCLGITLGIGAISFFEATLAGATNFVVGVYLLVTVLIHRASREMMAASAPARGGERATARRVPI